MDWVTCIGFSNYGFSIAWRTIWTDCGYGISVDKTEFSFDVLFYTIIGYGFAFLFKEDRSRGSGANQMTPGREATRQQAKLDRYYGECRRSKFSLLMHPVMEPLRKANLVRVSVLLNLDDSAL